LTGLLFALTAALLLISYRPAQGLLQTAATGSPTATATQQRRTPSPSITLTPQRQGVTRTPHPTKTGHPSPTPIIPPPEEIGSTNGIVAWGVVMVVLILAVILWHRPDWGRRRPPR
jgi:hypothetical protein